MSKTYSFPPMPAYITKQSSIYVIYLCGDGKKKTKDFESNKKLDVFLNQAKYSRLDKAFLQDNPEPILILEVNKEKKK